MVDFQGSEVSLNGFPFTDILDGQEFSQRNTRASVEPLIKPAFAFIIVVPFCGCMLNIFCIAESEGVTEEDGSVADNICSSLEFHKSAEEGAAGWGGFILLMPIAVKIL